MIDIIIPAYNAHDTIEQTLCSIAYQNIANLLNVYIIDDCSKKDYSDVVSFFENFINIKLFRLPENMGPGCARQYGIDHSNSEYIVFIDADDVFADSFSIQNLYNNIKENECDLVIGNFIEESSNQFYEHNNDLTWLHGKIYKRSFLEKYNIRFNETRSNEDNGFNQLILLCEPKMVFLNSKVYIWKNNSKSITRSNNHEYQLTGLEGFAYNINYALENGLERNCNLTNISNLAFATLISEYFYYLKYYDTEEIKKMLKQSKHTLELYNKFPLSEEVKETMFINQIKSSLDEEESRNILNPIISFDNYIELLKGIGD